VGTALLFRDQAVEDVEDWAHATPRLRGSTVLWIDLERPSAGELELLGERLSLSDETVSELTNGAGERASFVDCGDYLHVAVWAPSPEGELARVTCVVSERWVVTIRERPLEVVETFRERASGSGKTGRLDGLEFLAILFEWVLTSYFDAFERIEVVLEEVDTRAMSGDLSRRSSAIEELVAARRDIGRLRRALASHRETVLALTRPELEAIASPRSAERFAHLGERLEAAIQAARDGRDSAVGSFEVIIASTGQRTNEIMKVLTLVSVLILPGALLAGVMGMNFRLGLFDHAAYFWVVLGAMLAFAVATLAVARMRDWL
jgi:Mg2+ and Co2+ transporter CorA